MNKFAAMVNLSDEDDKNGALENQNRSQRESRSARIEAT